MFETTRQVLLLFGQFAVIGFALGFLYNALRFIRIIFSSGSVFTGITDFIFVAVSGLIIFIYSVELGVGNLRLFYLIAAGIGFSVYTVTLGNITALFARFSRKLLIMIFGYIKQKLVKPLIAHFKIIRQKIAENFVKIRQKTSIFIEKHKIHLKKPKGIVYNKNNNKIGESDKNGGEIRNVIKAKVRKNA